MCLKLVVANILLYKLCSFALVYFLSRLPGELGLATRTLSGFITLFLISSVEMARAHSWLKQALAVISISLPPDS